MLVCGTYERIDRLIDRSIHPVSFNSPPGISACLRAYKDRPRAQPFVCHMALPAATLSIHLSIHPSLHLSVHLSAHIGSASHRSIHPLRHPFIMTLCARNMCGVLQ